MEMEAAGRLVSPTSMGREASIGSDSRSGEERRE
jgi:hypothetical protein